MSGEIRDKWREVRYVSEDNDTVHVAAGCFHLDLNESGKQFKCGERSVIDPTKMTQRIQPHDLDKLRET